MKTFIIFLLIFLIGCEGKSHQTSVSSTHEKKGVKNGMLPPDNGFTVEERKKRFKIIDVHTHLSYKSPQKIYRIMNDSGISAMVNMSGGNFASDISQNYVMQLNSHGRIFNFYTPNWKNIDNPDFGRIEAKMLEKAVKNLNYKGLKISKALGLYVRYKNGKLVPVDDPILDPLWDKAGELGVPVLIHTGDPEAFWLPPDKNNERYEELKIHPAWSFYGKDVPPRMVLLKQRENVLEKHATTVFIGAHFGGNPEHPEYIARLLDEYPNFYIDLAARIPEIGRHDAKKMRKFFIKYQDRILFGTDIGIGPHFLMLGSSDGTVPPVEAAKEYYTKCFLYLESNLKELDSPTPIQGNWKIHPIHLPIDVLEKIYYKNAKNLVLYNENL